MYLRPTSCTEEMRIYTVTVNAGALCNLSVATLFSSLQFFLEDLTPAETARWALLQWRRDNVGDRP